MLIRNMSVTTCGLCALLPLIISTLFSFYAYRVNEMRAPDDPEKRDFSHVGIWMVPIVFPFLILFDILGLIVSSLFFTLVFLLFPFALLFFRKPFLIKWIQKLAIKIGNPLLEINTELLKFMGFYRSAPSASIRLQLEG